MQHQMIGNSLNSALVWMLSAVNKNVSGFRGHILDSLGSLVRSINLNIKSLRLASEKRPRVGYLLERYSLTLKVMS